MPALAHQHSHIRKVSSQSLRYISIDIPCWVLIHVVVFVVGPGAENDHAQKYEVSDWCTTDVTS